jgi:hypothetical protein
MVRRGLGAESGRTRLGVSVCVGVTGRGGFAHVLPRTTTDECLQARARSLIPDSAFDAADDPSCVAWCRLVTSRRVEDGRSSEIRAGGAASCGLSRSSAPLATPLAKL